MFVKMGEESKSVKKKIDAIAPQVGIYRYQTYRFGPQSCMSKHQKEANSLILLMHHRILQKWRCAMWKWQEVILCHNTSMMKACGGAAICFCTSHQRKHQVPPLYSPFLQSRGIVDAYFKYCGWMTQTPLVWETSEIVCSWWPFCGCPPCTPYENFYIQVLLFPYANNTDNCMRRRVICS